MKEKFVRINTIEGYENIKDYYWISNSDEDKIVNKDIGKQMKIGFDKDGYPMISLRTKDGKKKTCSIHVLKARAFIYGPNPLGVNMVRHLNDVKTDNRLINLAFGTQLDNMRDCIRNGNYSYEGAVRGGKIAGKKTGAKNFAIIGKKTGAKNGKKRSKPIKCVETGIIYSSAHEASRQTGINQGNINLCCNGKRQTVGGFHWEYVN